MKKDLADTKLKNQKFKSYKIKIENISDMFQKIQDPQ